MHVQLNVRMITTTVLDTLMYECGMRASDDSMRLPSLGQRERMCGYGTSFDDDTCVTDVSKF